MTEEQGHNHGTITITKLKKGDFYLPKSQVVGEVFSDMDEISCTVHLRNEKSHNKKEQKERKKQ